MLSVFTDKLYRKYTQKGNVKEKNRNNKTEIERRKEDEEKNEKSIVGEPCVSVGNYERSYPCKCGNGYRLCGLRAGRNPCKLNP